MREPSVDPYRFWYFMIFAGLTCIAVAVLAYRGALSLIEGFVGLGLMIFAFVHLKRLPKRWL
jgi:uncharacterized membrane protein YjjP (DUF1212 family)